MHKWNFFKTAKLVQVSIENGEDVANLSELDKKLWTVLSAPTDGLRMDERTLALIDSDKDGRIRVPELLSAVEWLKLRLKTLDLLFDKDVDPANPSLPFDAVNDSTDEGRALLKALKDIASQNGRGDATSILLSDVAAIDSVFKGTPFNGDGVITELSTTDAEVMAVIQAIISVYGATLDRSGKDGITQEKIDQFFADSASYIAWHDAFDNDKSISFLGENTDAAAAIFKKVEEKIDAYFTPPEDMPLVTDAPDPALPLASGIHPLWLDAFRQFAEKVASPVLGENDVVEISRSQWAAIKAKFAPYFAWHDDKKGAVVEAVGRENLIKWLDGGKMKAVLTELIQKDLALSNVYDQLVDAEKVIRLRTYFGEFICNYVNQARLYNPETTAVYQVGTLYIDARACKLSFHVANEGAHSALAVNSKCCIIYAKLTRPDSAPKSICAVVTAGTTGALFVGRHGLFYDRDGNDWDAVITKIVPAQVSLREAFWAPWVKMFNTIAEQAKKFLATKQDSTIATVNKTVASATTAEAAAKQQPAAGAANGSNATALASSVAALGVGIGMMGAACAGLLGLVAGLPLWKVAAGLVLVVLAVSMPSVIITWFKLRKRDLGAILNAGGWAVNRPLYFSMKLAKVFTRPVEVPVKAAVAKDPYASYTWLKVLVAIVVLIGAMVLGAWYFGVCPFSKKAQKQACVVETPVVQAPAAGVAK